MLENYTEKEIALAMFQKNIIDENELELGNLECARGNIRREDYMVLTDNEANDLWDERLENYIDDCILPGIPYLYIYYFDAEKWKNDARCDGRGHYLSLYDGEENYIEYNGTTYFIYRMN